MGYGKTIKWTEKTGFNYGYSFYYSLWPKLIGLWRMGIGGPPSVSSNWELRRVHFTSPNEGWAVGCDYTNRRGVLLHYFGGTWASVTPPSVSSFWFPSGVYFSSPGEGWAVGWDESIPNNNKGVLLHYSGGTWTSVSPPSVSSN